jgi:hypothetical protein
MYTAQNSQNYICLTLNWTNLVHGITVTQNPNENNN